LAITNDDTNTAIFRNQIVIKHSFFEREGKI